MNASTRVTRRHGGMAADRADRGRHRRHGRPRPAGGGIRRQRIIHRCRRLIECARVSALPVDEHPEGARLLPLHALARRAEIPRPHQQRSDPQGAACSNSGSAAPNSRRPRTHCSHLLPNGGSGPTPARPERSLTRADAAELESVVRSRAGAEWPATEDFSETHAATCAGPFKSRRRRTRHWSINGGRSAASFAVRARRFMRSMKRPLAVPVLHMRGDRDPYVLADPVRRTQRFAPHGRYVSIAGAGHFATRRTPIW